MSLNNIEQTHNFCSESLRGWDSVIHPQFRSLCLHWESDHIVVTTITVL